MLGYGAGFFFWIARFLGKTLIVNSDGMEWKRPKFGRMSRFLLRMSERFGLTAANVVVADSKCCSMRQADIWQNSNIPPLRDSGDLSASVEPRLDNEMAS